MRHPFIAIAVLILCAVLTANAAVILQDDFSGLDGDDLTDQTPSMIDHSISNNTWTGSAGSFDYNGSGQVEFNWGGNYRGAYFEIDGSYGATDILRLTAEVSVPAGSGWFAIGFATNNVYDANSHNTPWVIMNSDGATAPGSGSLFSGPGATGAKAMDPGANWTTGSYNTVMIEYDLNDDGDGNGIASFYVNGSLIATNTAMGGAAEMPPYLMMAGHQLSSASPTSLDSIKLEVVPEPGTLGLIGMIFLGGAALYRKRFR
jgi:hypothetical protein